MCRSAVTDGVKIIVATPRWDVGFTEPPLPFVEYHRKIERLETAMRGALNLKLGFALQFNSELPMLVERYGSILALGGKRHLLISLPSLEIPSDVEDVWKGLAQAGFSIVLAHPECNAVLRRNPSRLRQWVEEGLMLQVDAASVIGAHGREVRRFAIECLRMYEGRAVVASNARCVVGQKSSLGSVREELNIKIGTRQARSFIVETPATLIKDGIRHNNGRRAPLRGLPNLFRSISQIKELLGVS